MALYRLEVPVVAQPSSDTCWHAAAEMLWLYSQGLTGKLGPMNTLRAKYEANQPINTWAALAMQVGLMDVGHDKDYTSDDIMNLLKTHGPLWVAGEWYGVGHIIVVTGVDGETILLNDPDRGVKKTGLLTWFNTKRYRKWPAAVLAKDPGRY